MKLSFSTNAFINFSASVAVEKIAAIGYEGVEVLADIPHLFLDGNNPADAEKLREAIERTGITVSNINSNTVRGYAGKRGTWNPVYEPSLTSVDETERRWRIGYTKRCIDLARTLGCPNISLTSGYIMPDTDPRRSMELLKSSLNEILGYAGKKDVRIGLECEPGLLIEYNGELAALISEFDSDCLGANLDLGHSFIVGEDPASVITTLKDRIFHIHIEDIKEKRHYHLIPGSGEMDFASLLGLLARYGYDGFVTVNLEAYQPNPEEAAEKAFEYLRSFDVWPPRLVRK